MFTFYVQVYKINELTILLHLKLVAFTVDPLYHQTSAQFDEGGAKGLLLYNLGVYGGCRVLFDSFEAPENSILPETQTDKMELIDLSFLKGIVIMVLLYIHSVCTQTCINMYTRLYLCNASFFNRVY